MAKIARSREPTPATQHSALISRLIIIFSRSNIRMIGTATSEQFGDTVLDYSTGVPQNRETHFSKDDKKERYELLKKRLKQKLNYDRI